jgi:hypothetical protein
LLISTITGTGLGKWRYFELLVEAAPQAWRIGCIPSADIIMTDHREHGWRLFDILDTIFCAIIALRAWMDAQ